MDKSLKKGLGARLAQHFRGFFHQVNCPSRRKIRLIEGNAKCRHLKKLRQVFICLMPRTAVYLFTQGRGGGVEPERRLEGQQFTKLGRKYQKYQHYWLYHQSIDADEHLPKNFCTGQYFWMTTFCFGVFTVNESMAPANWKKVLFCTNRPPPN